MRVRSQPCVLRQTNLHASHASQSPGFLFHVNARPRCGHHPLHANAHTHRPVVPAVGRSCARGTSQRRRRAPWCPASAGTAPRRSPQPRPRASARPPAVHASARVMSKRRAHATTTTKAKSTHGRAHASYIHTHTQRARAKARTHVRMQTHTRTHARARTRGRTHAYAHSHARTQHAHTHTTTSARQARGAEERRQAAHRYTTHRMTLEPQRAATRVADWLAGRPTASQMTDETD